MADPNLGSASLITDMWPFKAEKTAPDSACTGLILMHVGCDNIHGSLKAALRLVKSSLVLNMYGMDDPELWTIVWGLIQRPGILV